MNHKVPDEMRSILLTGDTTLAGIARSLQTQIDPSASEWVVTESDFNAWQREAIDPDSVLSRLDPDFVVYILSPRLVTDLPDVEQASETFLGNLERIAGRCITICTTLVLDPIGPLPLSETLRLQAKVNAINDRLLQFRDSNAWFNLIDQNALFLANGVASVTDRRLEGLGRMYYSPKGAAILGRAICRAVRAFIRPPKKVLILDLDQTLWSGILGEGGIKAGGEGSSYAHLRFQRAVRTLKQNGVLLAICSKNDEDDALAAIASHPDMLLKLDDFVTHRINWKPKSENIIGIAEELNLGLDSFALFDDSPFERENVRQLLPQVDVLDVPADPSDYVQALYEYSGFDSFRITAEDRARSKQYEQESGRRALLKRSQSLEDFYLSLDMKATVASPTKSTLPRIHQLIMKTNQFNLTLKRYTEPEIAEILRSDRFAVWTLSLSDRLGESGLVGLAILYKSGSNWEMRNFLLSCRVIGRTVEYGFMRFIAEDARASGARSIQASFVQGPRNQVAADFLNRCGFQREQTNGEWILSLAGGPDSMPRSYVSILTSSDEVYDG
jgi:FkbH-like protein